MTRVRTADGLEGELVRIVDDAYGRLAVIRLDGDDPTTFVELPYEEITVLAAPHPSPGSVDAGPSARSAPHACPARA